MDIVDQSVQSFHLHDVIQDKIKNRLAEESETNNTVEFFLFGTEL